jgi:hypothetical protein
MIAVSNYFSLLFLAEGIVMPRTVGKKGQRYCIEKSWSVTALVEQDEIVAVHAFEMPWSPDPASRLSPFTRCHCIVPHPTRCSAVSGKRASSWR